MRTLILLFILLLQTGCSSKLAYDNIDWWVYWYIDDYIELNDQQEAQFDAYLQQWLSWHKTNELAQYKTHLDELKMQVVNDELDYDTIYVNFTRGRSHWERVRDEISPELALIAKGLSNDQVVTLFAALEKDNKEEDEELRENTALSNEERLESRIERIENNVKKRVGKLTGEQKQIIATYAEQFVSTYQEWLDYRRNIQNAARRLFVTRNTNENFSRELIALMQNPDSYKTKTYIQSSEHNAKMMMTMLAELMSTLTQSQKNKLIKEIDELIATVEKFQG